MRIYCDYFSQLRTLFGPDKLALYVFLLIGTFSPHRFLGNPSLLAAVAPIHARYAQFLKQYLELYYGAQALGAPLPQTAQTPHAHNILGLSALVACDEKKPREEAQQEYNHGQGHPVEYMEGEELSEAQRIGLLSAPPRGPRGANEAAATQEGTLEPVASGPGPTGFACKQEGQEESHTGGLFELCLAAVNDARIGELTLRDLTRRIAASKQYSPLITEMLSPATLVA